MEDHGPLLVDTGRGLSIRYGGKWLYSSRDPLAAPVAAARSADVMPDTLYVVPSPCLCYGVRELAERLPDSSAVLLIEADEGLAAIARRSLDETGADGAVASPTDCVDAYKALERGVTPRRFRRAVTVRLSAGRALHEEAYRRSLAAIDADISIRFRNRLSLVRMGRLWTKNVISNLGSMDWESVGPLSSRGRPVVACGAGPSLDSAIPALRRLGKRVFTLACDTAAGALAKAGVVPDAVVCLEGQVYNLEDFLPLDGAPSRLVVDLTSHPSSYRAASGPLTLTLSEYTESAFLGRLKAAGLPITAVPPLGSVGVLAIRVARELGGPVAVAGLDFSFMQGATHCAGSPSDLRSRRSETRLRKGDAAWAASFREGCERKDDGSLTDPALSMYASLAAAEFADSGRAYGDLRGSFGAPLPIPLINEDGLEAMAAAHEGRDDGKPFGSAVDPVVCRNNAARFLSGELERAEKVATTLRTGSGDVELRALLADADFLYAHFPDPERVIELEGDALRRVAAEASYWSGRLEAALDATSRR